MIRHAKTAAALCCLALIGCSSMNRPNADLSVYRTTNDQPGHELVRSEQFLVPLGTPITVRGIQFEPGSFNLTPTQRLATQQVFNCIEEITENTVNDTNSARVAEFKKMEFEIRGYGDFENSHAGAQLAKERADAVFGFLTYLGTPSWRLKTAVATNPSKKPGQIEFIRIR